MTDNFLIPFSSPDINDDDRKEVMKAMESRWLTGGPKAQEFEKKFAEYIGVRYAVSVNSCTAALHLSLKALGIKSGDEVIVPDLTFAATANAALFCGARPAFVDVDKATFNMSTADLQKKVTKKTKAVVAVDLYGLPADTQPIKEIAAKHGLVVIEDSAQAHGATYKGKPAGFFADVACWSLYASKNMMTGEGGIVTTNDDEIDMKLRMIRTHGERAKYASEMLGSNYRMPEIEAAIGLVQLNKLSSFVAKRRANAQQLTKILSKSKKLVLPSETKTCQHSWYLYTVRLIDATEAQRNKLLDDLKAKGIGAEAYYVHPINTMPYYRDNFGAKALPETEKASKQVFSLPPEPCKATTSGRRRWPSYAEGRYRR